MGLENSLCKKNNKFSWYRDLGIFKSRRIILIFEFN